VVIQDFDDVAELRDPLFNFVPLQVTHTVNVLLQVLHVFAVVFVDGVERGQGSGQVATLDLQQRQAVSRVACVESVLRLSALFEVQHSIWRLRPFVANTQSQNTSHIVVRLDIVRTEASLHLNERFLVPFQVKKDHSSVTFDLRCTAVERI